MIEKEWMTIIYIIPKIFIYYLYNKCLPVGINGATVWSVVFTVVEEDVDKDDWASPFGY